MRYGSTPDFDALRLGEDADPIEIETSDENRRAALSLVAQAQRTLDIVGRHLDPAIYDDAAFTDAVKRFVLASRRARVRILVQDPGALVRRGHRLLELARRLTSAIEVRAPAPEHEHFNAALLVVDRIGAVVRTHADRFEATVTFSDARTARELTRTIDEMWQLAKPDANLRRLHI